MEAAVKDPKSAAQAILGPVQHLTAGARTAGVPLIWIRNWHTKWTDSEAWVGRSARGGEAARAESWGAEFWGIQPEPEEWQRHDGTIRRFVNAGLLETGGGVLRLTARGVLLSNEVFQEFLTA